MKNIFVRCIAALLTVMLVSCLNDDKYALDPSGSNNVIEFDDPQVPNSPFGSIYPAWVEAFQLAPSATFTRTIQFAGAQSNDQDIVVQVEVDPTALAEYNRQQNEGLNGGDPLHGPTFELIPEANYQIDNATITIPRGQKEAEISVTIFPEAFDLSRTYALPLRIVSASTGVLSKHYSVGIFGVVVKNRYDANYDVDLRLSGWSAYGIQDGGPLVPYTDGIGLVTTGPNTVGLANNWAGTNLLPGLTNVLANTQFGNASPVFTFDDTGKLTSVHNAIAPVAGQNRTFEINPAAAPDENVFDADARSINLNFLMKQDGRPNQTVQMYLTFAEER